MPLIALFFGIRCTMFYDDHNPPHFHAEYNGETILVEIETASVLRGSFPSKQQKMVLAWCVMHQDELMQNWELARDGLELSSIRPLM